MVNVAGEAVGAFSGQSGFFGGKADIVRTKENASGAVARRSQPACVVVADNGQGFRTGVHAARYLHVLRPRQFESGTQHIRLRPFYQASPHGTRENERRVGQMTYL